EKGFNIILCARNQQKLDKMARKIVFQYPVSTEVITKDLSVLEQVHQLCEEVKSFELGLVVLNAGFGTSGAYIDSDLDTELNMLSLNCISVAALAHYFGRRFAEQGRGGLIMLSSIVAFQGAPGAANYAASKAYVQNLSEGLYHELKPFNVDVLSAAPGPVETGFAARANMQMEGQSPSKVARDILNSLGKRNTTFPGRVSKLLIFGLRSVPRWGKVLIMKKVMRSMTEQSQKAA
ncbi:SDR family NAD(P)-dependent oxidoreductase, partial [Gilvibacter sp.]|uniref:SDR family NAD(P)-dependent oxidoreductase n=1 Tax=Gilvibacter sp. TaxID=2729997 RepID=UPI003F4A04EC